MNQEPIVSINDLDAWIEKLYTCKPLTELEVKSLCVKVANQYYTFVPIFNLIIGKRSPHGRIKRAAS
jgi:hypothetical protein